jgi:hypothetical protein
VKIITEIGTAPWTPTTARGEPKPLAEELLKDVERISETAEVEATARPFETSVSEAIIGVPLLRIREHLIGFVDLLETRLGIGRVADIRVPLTCLLAVGSLYISLRGRTVDPKYFIIINSRCHNSPSSPTG